MPITFNPRPTTFFVNPMFSLLTTVSGQIAYTTPGSYLFTAPANVGSVSVVAVGGGGGGHHTSTGGGGGGAGGLGWINNYPVVPGNTYTVVVGTGGLPTGTLGVDAQAGGDSYFISTATVAGFGGQGGKDAAGTALGGSFFGTGGGAGGDAPQPALLDGGGGGGAGGYSGNGGAGASSNAPTDVGSAGAGGGGGGGGSSESTANGGGGGVGLLGQGANGTAGATEQPGGGGSGGVPGGNGNGGAYGGGGSGSDTTVNLTRGNGAGGAVRIIWGFGRAFPSTNTGDV